ncbi:MAG TPA: hypothetical protein VFF40_12420 [Acidimicrobiia bacterium]|nr:hypothetical protein [Acidimicrobiia bacterium]
MTDVTEGRSGPSGSSAPAGRGLIGALGTGRLARIDARGRLGFDGSSVQLGWWIGAEDRWHRSEDEVAVRQRRIEAAPAYETAMRIPSGDAVARVWAIGAPGEPVIVEIENQSPAPMVAALVLHPMASGGDVGADDAVRLDRGTELVLHRPARVSVRAADPVALVGALEAGAPSGGSGPYLALLQPVAHRTVMRAAVFLNPRARSDLDLASVPDADAAGGGWRAVASAAMQIVVADPARQEVIDRARVDTLLRAGTADVDGDVFGALEDWGFDDEARTVWRRLSWRARRRARHRAAPDPTTAAGVLRAARDSVIIERDDATVELVPAPPPAGAAVEVHDAPLRTGSVSFALRWHGDRPALLWDVRAPTPRRLVAPSLDPAWSTDQPSGEALLAPAGASAR